MFVEIRVIGEVVGILWWKLMKNTGETAVSSTQGDRQQADEPVSVS